MLTCLLPTTGVTIYPAFPLTVLEILPFLKSISVQNGQVQLDWEGWGRARLEGTTSLGAPDWQDLGIPETSNSVSLPLSNPHAFFRLRRP
jgi:hypothetical protein